MADNDESLPRLLGGGRYRLEAKLGHGGMGVVYRATDMTMHRPVAVKLIRSESGVELDVDVAGRFLREAKNTARIQHEHIIEVFDLGRSKQGLFFVMELLEGESLSTRMRRDTTMSPERTVHIGRQICAALHVAHTAGIVHRDLKPANVMLVERSGDTDFVKVLDFGVAKSYSSEEQTQLTHTGMLVGTIEYMAPEQIMGRRVDGRTDVYSLGIVLYRMLAGRAPFRDGGAPSLIHAHLNVEPKPLLEVAPAVPGPLARVIMHALRKPPEQRPESMEVFGRALAGALAGDAPALVDLEYARDEEDPYESSDQTAVARPSNRTEKADPAETFEDATVKMDRAPPHPSSRKAQAAQPDPESADFGDRTAVMVREEPTGQRNVPEGVREPAEPKPCAMCQTLNPPHVRACIACGVSLAPDEQAAVRARVAAPRTAYVSAPHIPPPASGAYPAAPFTPSQGVSGMPWTPPPAAPPSSMWERFLAWTRARGR